jgi:hypothetical protein
MDRVRFGRALGYGARHAAKTLAAAVEAATAPDPRRPGGATDAGSAGAGAPAGERARGGFQETVARVETVRRSAPQVAAQAKGVGRSVWKPLARFSSVLWLEVTGTFFTLIAVFVASGAWKLRGAIHEPVTSSAAEKLYLHLVLLVVFGYFAVSSFVRAHRRGQR